MKYVTNLMNLNNKRLCLSFMTCNIHVCEKQLHAITDSLNFYFYISAHNKLGELTAEFMTCEDPLFCRLVFSYNINVAK